MVDRAGPGDIHVHRPLRDDWLPAKVCPAADLGTVSSRLLADLAIQSVGGDGGLLSLEQRSGR